MFLTLATAFLLHALENPQNNHPNIVGGSGNLRTFSAEPNEPSTFGAALTGNFFTKNPFLTGIKNSRNQFRVDGNYTFDFGIPVEVFSGFTFTYNDNSTSASATTMTTFFENFDVGIRLGHSVFSEYFSLGGFMYGRAFSGTRAFRNTSGGTTVKSGPMMSGSAGFSATLNLKKKWPDFPLRQHFNIGYRLPNGNITGASPANDPTDFNRFALDSYHFQALVPSYSIELLYRWVAPFVEYTLEYALFADSPKPDFGDNRQKLTLGLRVTPMTSFSILMAGDIGIGGPNSGQATGIPKNPPYDIFFGLAFQTLGKKLTSEVGSVRGVVTDGRTGSLLPEVHVTLINENVPPFTTDISGNYIFERIANGNHQARFEKTGFEPTIKSFSIREGADTILDATLSPAMPKNGSLELIIVDQSNQPIRQAIITISGLEAGHVTDEKGNLAVNQIQEGEHTINAEAPGYNSSQIKLQILPSQTIRQTMTLQKMIPKEGTCTGTVKNADGTPLTAVFTSVDGKISPFGTDPVTGTFLQTLPQGSYQLKVQAENYLPQNITCSVLPGESNPIEITLEKPKQAVVIDNKIVLPDAIYFEFGKASIKAESLPILDQVVGILLKNDNFQSLKVEGHTDNVGGDAYNQTLSEKRAQSVRLYLIKKGVKGSKIAAQGFGKSKPIATNLTAEGRAENRRVEFNLVRNEE
jgi:outer membrane protein OmpA-like peptidoglycan-associated protein